MKTVSAAASGSASARAPIDVPLLTAAVWATAPRPTRSDDDARRDHEPDVAPRAKPPRLRPAAVLCPIAQRPEGLTVILTKRGDHLPRHPGQIAFPGGKVDPEDTSPLAAALREAEEEIGLTPDLVDVIGPLEPYETGTGFRITPFVGVVEPRFHPIADPGEVAEVFEVPLDFLMDPANRQLHRRRTLAGLRLAYAIPWQGYDIWGATAGMLTALAERIVAARP